jgi:hypothetical protein
VTASTKKSSPIRAKAAVKKSAPRKSVGKKVNTRSTQRSTQPRTVKKASAHRAPSQKKAVAKNTKGAVLTNTAAKKGLIATLVAKTKNALSGKKANSKTTSPKSNKVTPPTNPVTPAEGAVSPISIPVAVAPTPSNTQQDQKSTHESHIKATSNVPVNSQAGAAQAASKNVSLKSSSKKSGSKNASQKMSGKKVSSKKAGRVGKAKTRPHRLREL